MLRVASHGQQKEHGCGPGLHLCPPAVDSAGTRGPGEVWTRLQGAVWRTSGSCESLHSISVSNHGVVLSIVVVVFCYHGRMLLFVLANVAIVIA